MSRTPKVGEVWTGKISGAKYTCVAEVVAHDGAYPFTAVVSGKTVGGWLRPSDMVPPLVPLPDVWVNVYPTDVSASYRSTRQADWGAGPDRLARMNPSTGEVVRCDGQRVLS